MGDIGPHNRPFTVPELRAEVDELIYQFDGEPGVELLGLVAGMLATVRCHCAPPEPEHLAPVVPLRRNATPGPLHP